MLGVMIWFGVMLAIGGYALLHSGVGLLRRGLTDPGHADAPLWLARGLREVLMVICGAIITLGIVFDSTAALLVGGVILAEELYETGTIILILERRRKTEFAGTRRLRSRAGRTAC